MEDAEILLVWIVWNDDRMSRGAVSPTVPAPKLGCCDPGRQWSREAGRDLRRKAGVCMCGERKAQELGQKK